MDRITLEAKRRDALGKGAVRRLRLAGQIPGVVYGRGMEPVPVAVEARQLRSALRTQAGMNVLIDLAIGDGASASRTVMIKELQRDVFRKETITHVDFYAIDLAEKVEAHVPIVFKGQARGVADEGGTFAVHLREVIVECLPTQIPEHIEVDISPLGLGDSLHVRDLAIPAEATLISEPDEVVATVVAPRAEEVPAPAVPEAAVPAEGVPATQAAAVPTGAPAKPERTEEKEKGKGKE
ncbi:MAG: 50S ribosomal protein L25 [Armatimonadota bacterium]|nr:50S ribosomal protein L25 [Armatimonadota bacterium]MDR7451135.1 50S ribosomal protein L25 [Armatimonadota bacterium]MDR7467260.1 50S ribosomal protein L25 [Armatimonadota bacterium]MDR7494521.1 50S ribosomal protein L25 [Armatimonadota bacterium]MDR7499902.1 50S ribosomal protein L25 [Armatimonadota bacterium]